MHPKWTAIFLNGVNEGRKLWGGKLNLLFSLMLTTMLQYAISHGVGAGAVLPGTRHTVIIYDLVKLFNVV